MRFWLYRPDGYLNKTSFYLSSEGDHLHKAGAAYLQKEIGISA